MKKSTSSLLKDIARPVETKKKAASNIPDINGQEKLADKLHAAVVKAKDAAVEQKEAESDLLPLVEKEYERLARSGHFTKTLNIPGKDTAGIQISFQDRFSPIPIENETELRALDPKFDEHFEETRFLSIKQADHEVIALLMKKLGKNISDMFSISLKDTSDKTIDTLVEKLGADDFKRLFDVNLGLRAKEHLDEKMHEIPAAAKPFIKQAKGAVKLRASK